MFKVIQVAMQNLEKILKYKLCREFLVTFKFQILTLKRSFKWVCVWNKSCRILNFEQLSYLNFFMIQLKILRKLKVNFWLLSRLAPLSLFSLPSLCSSASAMAERLAAPCRSLCCSCSHCRPWVPLMHAPLTFPPVPSPQQHTSPSLRP